MANILYTAAKTRMLSGQFDWLTDPIVAILIADGYYTPSIHHETLLDVPASARVSVSPELTGKTVAINVVDADDCLFTAVTGPEVGSVVLVANSGTEATSWLICHLDSAVSGIPFSPATTDVRLSWNNGDSKIFSL